MALDGRGPDRGWQEDDSGMSMARFAVTFVALNALGQKAAPHPEPTTCQPTRQTTLMTQA